jgi:hypothetical protein
MQLTMAIRTVGKPIPKPTPRAILSERPSPPDASFPLPTFSDEFDTVAPELPLVVADGINPALPELPLVVAEELEPTLAPAVGAKAVIA